MNLKGCDDKVWWTTHAISLPQMNIHSLHRKFVHKKLTKIHLREFGGEVIKLNDSFLYSVSHAFGNNSCLKPAKKQPAFLSLFVIWIQHNTSDMLFSFFFLKEKMKKLAQAPDPLIFNVCKKSSKNFDDNLIIFKE